ncbi:MAG: tRNA (N6-threonylcarbamoyladenosine(37)-N6)-methyltransferase TrmO [Candidatus Scatosoma sp.]
MNRTAFQEQFTLAPVARIENDFKEKFGVPRQSGRANLISKITLLPPYAVAEAIRGIENFSHLWLIFGFSLNGLPQEDGFSPTVRPPRLGGNERVGVFASRSPFRPNPLGLSCVKLEKAVFPDGGGVVLYVSGADLVNGTPVYDIKPYLPSADKIEGAKGGYADEHAAYALNVIFPEPLLEKIPEEKREGLIACLRDDPRPAYQTDGTRVYGMRFAQFNVRFTVSDGVLTVRSVTVCETGA